MPEAPDDRWMPFVSDLVDVEPEDLEHFADLLDSDCAHFALSKADGFDALFQQYPPFAGGGSGLAEGRTFQSAYFNVAYAMDCLLAEVQSGLRTLQQAARHIAAEYRQGDGFSAASVDSVNRAFDVPPPLGTTPDGPDRAGYQDLATGDGARAGEDIVIREGAPGEVTYGADTNRVDQVPTDGD